MSHKSATSNAMLGLYFICLEYTLNKYIYKYIYMSSIYSNAYRYNFIDRVLYMCGIHDGVYV